MASFSQWKRNGRLATVALVIVFGVWLGFQIWVAADERPPMLDQILYTMSGAWLANIALAQDKRGKRDGDNNVP